MGYLIGAGALIGWLAGTVLAAGFWSTAFAVCNPFWAWYLLVERGMQLLGWAA